MTHIVKLWYRTAFWVRVEKSFLYVGSTITGTLVITEAAKVWTLIVIGSTIAGGLLGFWFSDENKNGVPDIFENNENNNP
jgi:hypothetical protein